MKHLHLVFLAIGMLFFSACTPVKPRVQHAFLLDRVPCELPQRPTHSVVVMVAAPSTRTIFNTTRMAYRIRPFQIAWFSCNAWAETPADMFQPLLVQTLQNSHYFRQIVTQPTIGLYDYVLDTEILALYQDFIHRQSPSLVMSVRVQISKMPSHKVIATRQFTVIEPFRPASPYGGVCAANRVTTTILKKIALFAADVMR